MGLLDFIERGPERSEWLSDTIGGAVEYLTPPNLRPVVEMAAQFNPIQGMSDSMSQFGVAVDPSRSMDERRAAALGSAVEGLLAVVPAAMASQGYMKPVQASMEGLLGWSPAGQAVGDELGRFVRSEGGSIGFDPVTQRGDEILDLLKRDPMRVTDEMLDMGADTPRLNEYLFRNYDLPMDQASRMARAEEYWPATSAHGTDVDISEIDNERLIGGQFWSTDDLEAIADREVGAARYGVTMPLNLDVKNPASWSEYDKFGTDELMGRGYDSLALKDEPSLMNPGTRTTYVTFEPEQVRSRFARFDPRLSHLKNLSAGIGAVGLLGSINRDDLDRDTAAYLGSI